MTISCNQKAFLLSSLATLPPLSPSPHPCICPVHFPGVLRKIHTFDLYLNTLHLQYKEEQFAQEGMPSPRLSFPCAPSQAPRMTQTWQEQPAGPGLKVRSPVQAWPSSLIPPAASISHSHTGSAVTQAEGWAGSRYLRSLPRHHDSGPGRLPHRAGLKSVWYWLFFLLL